MLSSLRFLYTGVLCVGVWKCCMVVWNF